jgi:DNA-binding NarL/FixJ family response regulator
VSDRREVLPISVLIVDDHEPFRRFVRTKLEQHARFRVIQEAADGLEASEKAAELQPNLIVLDIGLPALNGIEVARRIRKRSLNSKVIFVSQESSPEVMQEAFRSGALAYVVKTHAGRELIDAVDAVREGKQFVTRRLRGDRTDHAHEKSLTAQRIHEAGYYRNDATLVDDFIRFSEAALRARTPLITIATESHRRSLLKGLRARGWNISRAIREGSYISVGTGDVLSKIMVNDWPDSGLFLRAAGDLIGAAAKRARGGRRRVAVCGECAPTLCAQGKFEAAIRLEHLWDEISRIYDMETLCGYVLAHSHLDENSRLFERIYAEHSAAYPV